MINVTKSYFPSLDEYLPYLEKIWESGRITNASPLVVELEDSLEQYLGVKHLFFTTNGTIALQLAIKALDLKGEIITTPFSYVASTSCIVWEGSTPVFVDIHPDTLCIDPDKIEAAITPQTTAILAVHIYGYPCDVERIQEIADHHHLKVIYDASHAFGVRYRGESLLLQGDISTLSFHATKLFHTGEGGAVVTQDDDIAHRVKYSRNFGHNGPEDFWGLGINGKNSELHAAMGLTVLPHVQELIQQRQKICQWYDQRLSGHNLAHPVILEGVQCNYSYYPVLFPTSDSLSCAIAALNAEDIFPRRYFFPPLNKLPYLTYKPMPVAEDVSSRVLCLPLYAELAKDDVDKICQTILNSTGI